MAFSPKRMIRKNNVVLLSEPVLDEEQSAHDTYYLRHKQFS